MTSNFDEMTLEAIWNEIDAKLKEKPEPYKEPEHHVTRLIFPVKMAASSVLNLRMGMRKQSSVLLVNPTAHFP